MDNDFSLALTSFVQGVTAIWREYAPEDTTSYFDCEYGSRYIRVLRVETETDRFIHSFIDTTNGDVFKAASAKAPATNQARGNIFDDDNGLTNMGPHGPDYLKRGRKPKAVVAVVAEETTQENATV